MDKSELLISYLEHLTKKLKDKEIKDIDLEKIYQVMFLNYKDCYLESEEEDQKKFMDYWFLGWYIYENLNKYS